MYTRTNTHTHTRTQIACSLYFISNIWLLSLIYEKRIENEKEDDDLNAKKTEHKDKYSRRVEKYQYKFKYYVFLCLLFR